MKTLKGKKTWSLSTKQRVKESFYMQLLIFKGNNIDINEGKPLVIYHCGDDGGEDPPVLIPNTEVKLTCAENTLLATAREDR